MSTSNDIVVDLSMEESSSDDVPPEEEDDEQVNAELIVYHSFHFMKFGPPMPKPSVQVCHVKKFPKCQFWARNPRIQQMMEFREFFKAQHMRQVTDWSKNGFPLFPTGRVSVTAWFCRRPNDKYFINKDRNRPRPTLSNMTGIVAASPVAKPDTDNCVKFLLDALSTVAWSDDNQVMEIHAFKCMDTIRPYEGRTIVEITDDVHSYVHSYSFPRWSDRYTEP
jgi:Holliday junction resolvase RusA-like endonuclease